MGLRSDATIELVSGRAEVATLAESLQACSDVVPVALCWTGQRASLTRLKGVRRLGMEQVFDVELDDGNKLAVSPSSEFVMKSGVTKSVVDLEPGDSLLPLYLGEDAHGYTTYQIPGRAIKRKLSRLVAEWKLGHSLEKGTYVEHEDKNRKNCHPDNLLITVDQVMARRSFTPKVVKTFLEVQELFDECAAASEKMAKIIGKRRRKAKTNHKVMSVTPGLLSEVFTVITDSECSLAVSGVFLSLPSC